MLQITLAIKNNEDENLWLGIGHTMLKKEDINLDSLDFHSRVIEQGVDVADFDTFLQEFNNSRKNRWLSWRQNHA
ncbi:hypothetical protein CRENPOLYSF2_2010004 [Crenothrix polyspora]|uniref:Uncharacterized protein n=1 Tax=Crenothrix polyspora TaxID=360316 RepID=A0A1R4H4D2_9GAMM|nr:hypothetical protein [Crenothrix polyspora]SJM91094.1 hypothetical protein CRENPOLYSF2_2010004 [Crenothrix polyspora]